jgi:hypothetical protein
VKPANIFDGREREGWLPAEDGVDRKGAKHRRMDDPTQKSAVQIPRDLFNRESDCSEGGVESGGKTCR